MVIKTFSILLLLIVLTSCEGIFASSMSTGVSTGTVWKQMSQIHTGADVLSYAITQKSSADNIVSAITNMDCKLTRALSNPNSGVCKKKFIFPMPKPKRENDQSPEHLLVLGG